MPLISLHSSAKICELDASTLLISTLLSFAIVVEAIDSSMPPYHLLLSFRHTLSPRGKSNQSQIGISAGSPWKELLNLGMYHDSNQPVCKQKILVDC